uniref:Phospholipid-transporting ATPase n=1 Tax=Meloidogyne hapla TaxID=6305 RepID=A0A1I8B4S0_MELHA
MDWIRSTILSYSPINGANSLGSSISSHSAQPQIPRIIIVNSEHQRQKYCGNQIRTCKYNILTFLPFFLFEQFHRYSNVFFLCIAILQQIPEVSPTGKYTTGIPFLIILSISAIKEIFEDIKRHRMDIEVNNYRIQTLIGNTFQICRWKRLKVGQIVKVYEGRPFPADIVILTSSEPMGMAYIETAQLDGETNLKIRQALPETSMLDFERMNHINLELECEHPNRKVNEFTGTLHIGNDLLPLNITQFLLRGAKLKNCKWVCGVIVYTGHESRLLMNSTAAPLKTVIGAEFFNWILANSFYINMFQRWSFLWNALTFFILYNNIIPISLQVTLEVVRFFQAGYINQDLKMYDENVDIPANARTSNLNEELGQIQYLMTDKTGTLTRNVMKFKRCQIGGVDYGDDNHDEFSDGNLLKDLSDEKPFGLESFDLLNVLEFTSDRKRMSVILKDKNNKIKLYCKGADNIIFERLSPELNSTHSLECATLALTDYAEKGYRTLCFAMAEIDSEFYLNWIEDFKTSSTSLEKREEKLAVVSEKVECNLRLVGVSAIEDKLQENVPLTIRTLLSAGIFIWMLTGDKLETAIQISHSSSITSKDTKLMKIVEKSFEEVLAKLNFFINLANQYIESRTEFALVIDGGSLHHAFIGEARPLFSDLIGKCQSVICCRMTPIQKAEIVHIVKVLKGSVLAVGDGANDVAMIRIANVGVGITGVEGLQAASASDYSIAQFQYLTRLILIHGTWNYERTVKVILYSFYKNICLYIIELWFAFFSAFSGVTIFERWSIASFNIFFTAWPPIILGLFDRPISQKLILKHPRLYQSFQKMAFSNYRFVLWISLSLWHSLLLFFFNYGFYGDAILWSSGKIGGWLMFGNSLYSYVVMTVCLKALLECDSLNFIIIVLCIGSIVSWFIFLAFYSMIWPLIPISAEMKGMYQMMIISPNFWLGFVFIPLTTLLFDFVVKSICTSLRPSPREKLCSVEKKKTVGCHITDLSGGQIEEVRHISDEMDPQIDQTSCSPLISRRNDTPNNLPYSAHYSKKQESYFQTSSIKTPTENTSVNTNLHNAENYGTLNK